jgi:hypothetical protein
VPKITTVGKKVGFDGIEGSLSRNATFKARNSDNIDSRSAKIICRPQ